MLEKRRKHSEYAADDAAVSRCLFVCRFRYFGTLRFRFLKVGFDLRDDGMLVDKRGVFKLVEEASVIEINRTDDGRRIVGDEHFRVNEAGRKLVYAYAVFDERIDKHAPRAKRDKVIDRTRDDQRYVHSAPRGKDKRIHHLVIDDDVGRRYVHILFRLRNNIIIDVFRDVLIIVSVVAVRNDDSRHVVFFIAQVEIGVDILFRFGDDIPEFQKHAGKRAHGRPRHTDNGIFPITVFMRLVDILIAQIDAAGKCRFPVDDADFSVIAVVEIGGEYRYDRCKDRRLQTERTQIFLIASRRKRCTAEAVVHDANFDALFALFNKGIENRSPHDAGEDCKIFHKDEFFCSLHRPYHFGKGVFAARIIRNIAVQIRQKNAEFFK